MRKTTLANQSRFSGFPYKSMSLNLSLTPYRTQIFCYEQRKFDPHKGLRKDSTTFFKFHYIQKDS